tara:strand:- start:42 stop:380 length:339 start_codon:yes stop_codon:yes gene_type:complete
MKRLAAEYDWTITKEDMNTWAAFARQLDIDIFLKAVALHLSDTSEDRTTGRLRCQKRPVCGQIMKHAEGLIEQRRQRHSAKKMKQWGNEAVTKEQAAEYVKQAKAAIREAKL